MPPDVYMQKCTAEPPASIDPTEAQLVFKAAELWKVHQQAAHALGRTREGLQQIRKHLARRLHELKGMLSRPGRGGEWSKFLSENHISRTTADRLVRTHTGTLAPAAVNCTTGATGESTKVAIQRQVRSLWQRLSQVLRTPESLELFVSELRRTAEESFRKEAANFNSTSPAVVVRSQDDKELAPVLKAARVSVAAAGNSAHQQDQSLDAVQYAIPGTGTEPLEPSALEARQPPFKSHFLLDKYRDSPRRHVLRSSWRARLRSARRKEELLFGLGC
jgi:hypothetical protein